MEATPDTGPRRALGFWICLALVMGNTIGTGIFLLPAALAPYGANAVAGWLVTIAGCLCLARVFAALARALPEADGPYDYIRPALGAPAAFFVMWSYWISTWVTNAAVAIGAVSYLSSLAPAFFVPLYAGPLTAIAFVVLFTVVATRGAKASGEVQVATTILKLVPLIAVVALAAIVWGGRGEAAGGLAPMPLGPSPVAAAATLTLWAMLGFESATVPSGRVRDPQRTVARATLAGTFLVGIVYLLTTWAVLLLLPTEEAARSSAPLADLVSRYWGPGPAALIALFAAISALGALNGWVFLQAEVPLALARSGVFPAAFARLNRAGTPSVGHAIGCALSCALIATNLSRGMAGLFEFMILLATAATLVLYLLAALSALILRRRGVLRGASVVAAAIAGTIFAIWTFYGAGLEASLWGLALLASGLPVYLFMRRNLSRPRTVDAASSTVEE
ncbi:MAG TPA: amino acid permease [Allosphingosinicella sp.]|jgi:APA family basic amino acid/polyamine antiporter|nr:amino acid permease [Allosphingosinicella sp.]